MPRLAPSSPRAVVGDGGGRDLDRVDNAAENGALGVELL
jgi:hypothetical protein